MAPEARKALRQEMLSAAQLLIEPGLAAAKKVREAYSSPVLVNGVLHTLHIEISLERSPVGR